MLKARIPALLPLITTRGILIHKQFISWCIYMNMNRWMKHERCMYHIYIYILLTVLFLVSLTILYFDMFFCLPDDAIQSGRGDPETCRATWSVCRFPYAKPAVNLSVACKTTVTGQTPLSVVWSEANWGQWLPLSWLSRITTVYIWHFGQVSHHSLDECSLEEI